MDRDGGPQPKGLGALDPRSDEQKAADEIVATKRFAADEALVDLPANSAIDRAEEHFVQGQRFREEIDESRENSNKPVDGESMAPDPRMTLILEKIRVGLKSHVSPEVLSQMVFDQKYDPIADKVIMELGMYLFSNKIHTETTKEDVPMTWWDGFKDAYFPGFLSRRFPSRFRQVFKEVKTIHVCPHLNYHTREDEKFHLQFLMPEGELTRYSA